MSRPPFSLCIISPSTPICLIPCVCVCVCTCILSGLAPRMCVVCVRMSQAHHTVILPHIQCCCQCGCLRCGFAFVSTMSHSGYLCPAQCVWFYLSYALYRAWYTPQSAKVLQMEWVHMWGSLVSSQPHTVLDSWCIQQLQLFLTASHLLQSTYYAEANEDAVLLNSLTTGLGFVSMCAYETCW
jgi:hypothetical protein